MQSAQPSVFARDHTFFGVCEALGEDFGFNPDYLRVALALVVFWNPVWMVAAYAAGGVLVVLSRLLVPNPAFAKASAGQPAASEPAPLESANSDDAEMLAVAA